MTAPEDGPGDGGGRRTPASAPLHPYGGNRLPVQQDCRSSGRRARLIILPMSETEIRSQRRRTNKLIAEHKAERLRPLFDAEIRLIAGDGTLIQGADAVVEAFAGQFEDATFVTYLRTTESVTIDGDGKRAAEPGTWVATWRGPRGDMHVSGRYLAVWKKTGNQWVIESELFITLA